MERELIKEKGGNLVDWETVQQPKEKGGLGVINLKLQNDALLLKHLHKFYNQADIPWVKLIWFKYYEQKVPHASREVGSFWWKDILRLNPLYRGISHCIIGNGTTVCFWEDRWNSSLLKSKYPRLASFSKSNIISVQEIMEATELDTIFILPLSQQAMEELDQLQNELQNVPYDENAKDQWQPLWGNEYTSKKFYNLVFSNLPTSPILKMISKSQCTARVKFFTWLLLIDRLNTKTMLSRRHIQVHGDDLCVMCSTGEDETIEHLFFTCPFASLCWNKININWDLALNLEDRLNQGRQNNGLNFILEASMIATWELWKIRNDKNFNRGSPSVDRWLCNFKSQSLLQSIRFKADLQSAFCFWLDAFS